jgi:hypothetical protein
MDYVRTEPSSSVAHRSEKSTMSSASESSDSAPPTPSDPAESVTDNRWGPAVFVATSAAVALMAAGELETGTNSGLHTQRFGCVLIHDRCHGGCHATSTFVAGYVRTETAGATSRQAMQ